MKKLLFFDIDGTLIPYRGEVPESARRALARARQEGCGLMLCSGRSEGLIPAELRDLGFDGIISADGATISWNGRFVRRISMGPSVCKLLRVLEEHQVFFTLQTPMDAYTPAHMEQAARASGFGKLDLRYVDMDRDPMAYSHGEKAVFVSRTVTIDDLRTLLEPEFHLSPGSYDPSDPYCGEITMTGVNKASAMAWLGEYLGVRREDMIAFGDGPNDLEMLRYAGIGVAMGNAIPAAKEAADMVTDDVAEDGLSKAMAKLLGWE